MPSLTTIIAGGLTTTLIIPLLALAATTGNGPDCAPTAAIRPTTFRSTAPGADSATISGTATPEPEWDEEQTANAALIVAIGRAEGVPNWGWVIAVATAIQESRLRNLPDGDADSIGIFQQRPSAGWGTPTQLRSPAYQTRRFYDALLHVPNWQHLPPGQASQAVQHSAFPNAYAPWTAPAARLVEHLTSFGPQTIPTIHHQCALDCPPPSTDRVGDPGGCTGSDLVLARAATWLTAWNGGPVPYSMSTDPADRYNGYRRDCSGYASMALGLPGPGLNTATLAARATPIPKTALRAGDLLINPASGGAGHVVIFDHWTNAEMNRYVAYEQATSGGTRHRTIPYAYDGNYPMAPYRLTVVT